MKTPLLAAAIWLLFNPDALAVDIPDEATKIEALKLGYILNGNSMVRYGSIDLTTPGPPMPPYIRTIPITPDKAPEKKKKDK